MHDAPLWQVIRICIMLRHAVIPDSHVIWLPAPAHLKLWFRNMREQEAEQRLTLFLRHIDNARGEAFVDKQRLLTTHRMGSNHRMPQRRMLRHRFTPALMLLFCLTVLVFLEGFTEVMFRPQTAQQLAKRFRQRLIRRNAAGP